MVRNDLRAQVFIRLGQRASQSLPPTIAAWEDVWLQDCRIPIVRGNMKKT